MKRFISLVLVLVICMSLTISVATPATYASSNDRIKTFLKMAAGGEITNEDISGLTKDQLQFLGVYLSNFYQPFGTEFGGSNTELSENCKADMVKALQNKLAFSDEMASALVDYVMAMTRSSIQYLDVYAKDEDGNYVCMKDVIDANYFNYLRLMLGLSEDVFYSHTSLQEHACMGFDRHDPFNKEDATDDPLSKGLYDGGRFAFIYSYLRGKDYYKNCLSRKDYYKKEGIQIIYGKHFITEEDNVFSDYLYESLKNLSSISGSTGDAFWYNRRFGDSELSRVRFYGSGSTPISENRVNGLHCNDLYADELYFMKHLFLYSLIGGTCKGVSPLAVQGETWDSRDRYNNVISISFLSNIKDSGEYERAYTISKLHNDDYISVSCHKQEDKGTNDFRVLANILLQVENVELWEEAELLLNLIENPDKLYFGYEKNGEVMIVADCATTAALTKGENYTPSQVEFMRCLETVDMAGKGYGFNIFDFNREDGTKDAEWDAQAYQNMANKIAAMTNGNGAHDNSEYGLKSTMWGEKMAVDCFGNLIVMGYNHQYIAVPACMNPFVWQPVDSKGEDVGSAGDMLNMVNAKNIVQADNGIFYKSGSLNTDTDVNNSLKMYVKNNLQTTNGYSAIGHLFSSSEYTGGDTKNIKIAARLIRGLDAYLTKDNRVFWWNNTDYCTTGIRCAISAFRRLHPNDLTVSGDYGDSNNAGWWYWEDAYYPMITKAERLTDNSTGFFNKNNQVNLLTGFLFIDNLGVYKNPDGSDHDYSAFNVESYLDMETGETKQVIEIPKYANFGNNAQSILSGSLDILPDASEQALSSIYLTYVYAYFYTDENREATVGKLGYRFAKERLPDAPTGDIDIDLAIIQVDFELNAIRDWTYYLLHPTKGFEYVTTLITNKLNHLLLGWHSDMVGTNGVGALTGTTKYRSNVGYVTMPDLSEIEWTDKLISFYQTCLPFLIIVIMVIMLLAFITGVLSFQRAVIAAIMFSVFLMIPTTLINGAVQQSNSISQRIYGEKFTYWAMIQQETYARQIDEAANAAGSSGKSTYDNYLRTLYGLNQEVYSNQGMESVLLKWQAPKKMASLVLTEADGKSLNGLSEVGKSMLFGMLGRSYGGQSYVDDEDAVYMYRSYIDISNFSRYIYGGIDSGKVYKGIDSDKVKSLKDYSTVKSTISGSFSDSLVKAVSDMGTTYTNYRKDGYTNWGMSENRNSPDYAYITVPLSSSIMADAIKNSAGLETWDSKDKLIGINQDIFNFGIPMFTNPTSVDFSIENFAATGNIPESSARYSDLEEYMGKYNGNPSSFVGLASYALYSENPFYYFSWKLYHDGLGYSSSLYDTGSYKDLLLSAPDGGYFYNNAGNGGLKDFMDMKSLFTYIIPYMKECNDLVRKWDDTYGIFLYEGVPTEEGHWADVQGDPELTAKYWHNLNVARLYCLYCPWVDVMYDCSYAQPATISVLGKRTVISDPLNPSSYPADRPMIFSEAEMKDYGLSEGDLTPAERLILKCNEDFQERMYELLNYYNFSDITLNTAAAMQCAFSFNTIFSETGVMTENHNIYPQSYDLANFSYDAFLRFILSESTGESMLDTSKQTGTHAGETSGDFYERVVNNSSTTTAIVMIILDVLSIYVLPAFKMFFLVAAFLSSILIVFVSLCKIEDNAKFFRKACSGFILPLLEFFAVTVGLSLVISLFMGKGNNSVTQTDELSISFGDPVITILVMIAIDILVLILYWKIIKAVMKDIKFNAKMAFNFATGVIGAAGGMVAGAFVGAAHATAGTARAGIRTGKAINRHNKRKEIRERDEQRNETLEEINKKLGGEQVGTGIESGRAAKRGSRDVSSSHDTTSPATTARTTQRKKPETPTKAKESAEKKGKQLDSKTKSGVSKIKSKKSKGSNSGKKPVQSSKQKSSKKK